MAHRSESGRVACLVGARRGGVLSQGGEFADIGTGRKVAAAGS